MIASAFLLTVSASRRTRSALFLETGALRLIPAGIAYHSRPAADDQYYFVPVFQEPPQYEKRLQLADLKRIRRGVDAEIQRPLCPVGYFAKFLARMLVHIAALLQDFRKFRHIQNTIPRLYVIPFFLAFADLMFIHTEMMREFMPNSLGNYLLDFILISTYEVDRTRNIDLVGR